MKLHSSWGSDCSAVGRCSSRMHRHVSQFSSGCHRLGAGKLQQGTCETKHWIPPGYSRDIFYSAPWRWHHYKGPQDLSCLEERQLQGCCISSISPLNTTLNFEEQWQSSTALTLRHFSFEMHFALTALAREGCRGGKDAAYKEGFVCHRIRVYII